MSAINEPRTVDDLLMAGTPDGVASLYRSLASKATDPDCSFGPIEEDVIVLDTETTGLSFRDCELIEVAAVRLSGREIVDRFESYVRPARPIPPEIEELTGITNDMVANAPGAAEVVADLVGFVGGCPVIAHNATFDRTFVEKVPGGQDVSDLWIDSLALSRIALPRLASHKLQDLARVFGCPSVSHRAMADVEALAGMWRVILCGLAALPSGLAGQLASMHPEVDWAYRPLFSYIAGEQGAEMPFSLVQTRRELVRTLGTQAKVDAKEWPGNGVTVPDREMEAAFEGSGLVGSLYEAFEPRPAQKAMAVAVNRALATSSDLVVEAGTGVGKSMAYLLPLALYAKQNHVTCGVATKTNALTDQLVSHELPLLDGGIPGGLSYVSLKGYDHYPCLRKVEGAMLQDLPVHLVNTTGKSQNTVESDMLTAVAVTLAAACQTAEGDLDSLGIRWRNVPRSMMTTTPDECLHNRCPFFAEGCLLHGARRRAASADIVVTNHSLLLTNVAADQRILPPVRHWMVDEAHGFDSEARRQWALAVAAPEARRAFETLGGVRSGAIHKLMVQASSNEAAQPVQRVLSKGSAALARAMTLSADFFDDLVLVAQGNARRGGYDTVTLWIDKNVRETAEWAQLEESGHAFEAALEEAMRFLQDAQALAAESIEDASTEMSDPLRDLGNLRLALKTVLDDTDESYVYYLEVSLAKNRRGEERLVAEKLDVGAELASRWYPETKMVGYCSATLAVGNDFSHFEHAVGLDCLGPGASQSLRIPSSYDFDRHMAVAVVKDLPDPYSKDYLPAMADALVAVHEAMEGSVLTLFTNRRDMEQLYAMVSPRLRDAGLDLVQQTRGANVRRLREKFVGDEKLSLFALKSFWEGFDAVGDTLRCVVIPKLPFANPNDPLVKEREARDPRAWWHYSLPEAVLAVKQAAGRLIRSSHDQGVLVLLDSRLTAKRYGGTFIKSLPSSNVTRLGWGDLKGFIDRWREGSSDR